MTKGVDQVLSFITDKADEDDLRKIRNLSSRVLYGRHKQVSKQVVAKVSPEAWQIANHLALSVKTNFAFIADKSIDVHAWSVDIDKINRIDKIPFDVIIAVAGWSQQDDFWKQNIRSGGSLRRHFEKMLVKIKSDPKLRKTVEI